MAGAFFVLPNEELLYQCPTRWKKKSGTVYLAGSRGLNDDTITNGRVAWANGASGRVQVEFCWSDIREIQCNKPAPGKQVMMKILYEVRGGMGQSDCIIEFIQGSDLLLGHDSGGGAEDRDRGGAAAAGSSKSGSGSAAAAAAAGRAAVDDQASVKDILKPLLESRRAAEREERERVERERRELLEGKNHTFTPLSPCLPLP